MQCLAQAEHAGIVHGASIHSGLAAVIHVTGSQALLQALEVRLSVSPR